MSDNSSISNNGNNVSVAHSTEGLEGEKTQIMNSLITLSKDASAHDTYVLLDVATKRMGDAIERDEAQSRAEREALEARRQTTRVPVQGQANFSQPSTLNVGRTPYGIKREEREGVIDRGSRPDQSSQMSENNGHGQSRGSMPQTTTQDRPTQRDAYYGQAWDPSWHYQRGPPPGPGAHDHTYHNHPPNFR